ncbi:MAG: alpha/beta fold hydrolase [Rhodospirillaceae bacterium]
MSSSRTSAAGAAAFVSRFYTSHDGLKLHYRDYPGPPNPRLTVICIPGLTRNARDFEDVAPHLADRYRVLCVELRGRGQSEYAKDPMTYVPPVYVRDIIALMNSAGLMRAALIGTSLGGIISMVLAAVIPHRLLGVVINDIGPELDPVGLARIGSYVGRSKPVRTWEEAAAAIQAIDGVVFPEYKAEDWARMARRRFIEAPEGGLRANYDLSISQPFIANAKAVDLWPFFTSLRMMPVLAIRGANTDLLSPAVFDRMQAEVPHLQRVTVPNRGHAPYLDEPEARGAIDKFLDSLPAVIGPGTAMKRRLASLALLLRLKLKGAI